MTRYCYKLYGVNMDQLVIINYLLTESEVFTVKY